MCNTHVASREAIYHISGVVHGQKYALAVVTETLDDTLTR